MLKNFLVILLFPFLVNGQSAFISGDATICDNGISAELVVSFTGTAPFTFSYAINGVVQPQLPPIQDDVFVISTKIAGFYTLNQFNDALSIGTIDGSALVTILESPEAIIHIESDTLSIINPTAFFKVQPENNTFNYDWNFGDNISNTSSSVVHTFPIDEDGLGILGIYETSLIVTDGNGCSDTAVKPIWVRDEYWIYIPNSFTPDFDEKHRNEKFCLEYHAIRENTFLFKVFNTQGDLMFQSANPLAMKCSNKAGWDGKHYETQKELPADTYVFELYFQDFEGWKHQEFGEILLVR